MSRVGSRSQFSALDGYGALLEDPRGGEEGSAGEPDLLAEEREAARGGSWWRPWWLSLALSGDWFRGGKGTWVAVGLLVVMGGWLVYMMATGGGRLGSAGVGGWEVDPGEYAVSGEAGRVLRSGEVEVALAYGQPVELGAFGRPVVLHGGTGERRELTPVEVEFFDEHGARGLEGVALGVNEVWWNPGPQGWGMWWREPPVQRFARPELAFTRKGWREKQERELQWLGDTFGDAALVMDRLDDPMVRQRGLGVDLARVLDRIADRYPTLRERRGTGAWAALPTLWVCDEELELAVSGGITQRCPSSEYRVSLSEVWGSAGAAYDGLVELARLLVYLDGLSTEEYFRSGLVPGVFFKMVDLVQIEFLNLAGALGELRRVSAQREFFFAVEFFESGPG